LPKNRLKNQQKVFTPEDQTIDDLKN